MNRIATLFYIISCTITLVIYDITCFTEHDKPGESDSSEQESPKEQKIRKLDQRPGKTPREKLSASEGVFRVFEDEGRKRTNGGDDQN